MDVVGVESVDEGVLKVGHLWAWWWLCYFDMVLWRVLVC
jgi:hypothetical protein